MFPAKTRIPDPYQSRSRSDFLFNTPFRNLHTRHHRCKTLIIESLFSMAVPSAEFIDDDLLTEIHLRLPVTSILRFRSVSKHWRRLLTDRRFTLRYDNKHSVSPGIFVRNNKYISFDAEDLSPPPFRTLDFFPHPIRILQSCNGLFLCCNDNNYYVINPTTNQFAVIPSVPVAPRFVGLAFHPTTCPHYKVVCILPLNNTNLVEDLVLIQIYSSETGEWKMKTLNTCFSDPDYGSGVYWNGAIHWAPSSPNPSYFDLNLEQLRKLPLPTTMLEPLEDYPLIYFGECRGHLHMVHFVRDGSRIDLIVYEMLMDHSGWFVKYKVDLHDLPGFYRTSDIYRYGDLEIIDVLRNIKEDNTHLAWIVEYNVEYNVEFPGHRRLLKFHVIDVVRGEEEEEDTFMVLNIQRSIIRYNVMDKSFKELFDQTHSPMGLMEGHRYMQSLASL